MHSEKAVTQGYAKSNYVPEFTWLDSESLFILVGNK